MEPERSTAVEESPSSMVEVLANDLMMRLEQDLDDATWLDDEYEINDNSPVSHSSFRFWTNDSFPRIIVRLLI